MYLNICFLIIVLVFTGMGCARRPPLPDQTAIPVSQPLPLDGSWRLSSGHTGSIFRIDKGRMFFVDKQKPLPKNSPLLNHAIIKNPKNPSAADLVRRPGEVIMQDIQKTANPMIYSGQAFFYDAKRRLFALSAAELQISTSTSLVMKIPPNPAAGLMEEISDGFLRESLDNQAMFDQALLPPKPTPKSRSEKRSRDAGMDRKVIPIPMDKMESGGQLSKSAQDFIEQTLKETQAANGWINIKLPVNAPDAVVRNLKDLGVDTQVDNHISFYELVIVKP